MPRPHKSTSALVPAAARAGSVLTDDTLAAHNSAAIETFLKAVGGRAQLTDVLAIGAAGGDLDKVTTLLLDPRYEHFSVKRVCTMAGITVVELFASYKKALIARAHIEATHVIAGRLVPIVTDVMDKALSDPTVERHKLALELGQLTEKKAGIVMQQNTIAAGVSASVTQAGALEQLQQAVGDLLFSPRRKSEVVRDEPPSPRTPFTEEEEPRLPFTFEDPPALEEPPRRRPDLPGVPEERTTRDDSDDDPDDDPAADDPDGARG
jgi:hypothetical protein